MNRRNAYKRIAACSMALMFALLSCYTPGLRLEAAAATGYSLVFVDGKEETDSKTIIEGTDIKIRATLPAGYTFSDPPFAVKKAGEEGDASANFDIIGDKSFYTLTARPPKTEGGTDGSAGGSLQEYSLNAVYKANMTVGDGNGKYTDPTDPAKTNVYALTVKSEQPLAIIEESKLEFDITSSESEDTGMMGFSEASGVTGAFSNYNAAVITGTAFDKGKRTSTLTIAPKTGTSLVFTVDFAGASPILAGTHFTIYFRKKAINPLIATVVTEQRAVEEVAALIKKAPTDPEATGDNIPFILLDKNDQLDAIRKNPSVRTKVHYFNQDIKLKWTWTAEEPSYQSYVNITQAGKVDIINRPLKDMKGKLTAEATFGKSTNKIVCEIPIVIYGTGEPVSVKPASQWTGVPGAPDKVESNITEFPKNMDVYNCKDVDIVAYPFKPKFPYSFMTMITYGSGRGEAKKMIIRTESQGGELEAMIDGEVVAYQFGSDLENLGASRSVIFTATKKGQLKLIFEFYNSANELMKDNTITKQLNIEDSRPRADAKLKSLDVKLVASSTDNQEVINSVFPSGVFVYPFDPVTNEYNITVPYKAEKIVLCAALPPATGAKNTIKFQYGGDEKDVTAGKDTADIPLQEQVPMAIKAIVTAENGSTNTYIINVTRDKKSTESRLESLGAYRTDVEKAPNLITGFSSDTHDYSLEVPYRAAEIELKLNPKSPWIEGIKFDPAEKTTGFWIWKKKVLKFPLKCEYDQETGEVKDNLTNIKITVTAEDGIGKTEYNIIVKRLPPSVDNTLKDLKLTDKNNKDIAFDEGQKFDKEVRDYYVHIPYSTLLVNVLATPNHEEAVKLKLTPPPEYKDIPELVPKRGEATLFRNVDVSQNMATPNPKLNNFIYALTVTAESGAVTAPPYNIHFTRNDPDADTRLASLAIVDGEGKAIESFAFNQEQLTYDINVPNEITRVTLTPKAVSPLAVLEADGVKLSDKRPTVTAELLAGQSKSIAIKVTAESAATRIYTVKLTRAMPSTEARLSELVVDTLPLKPKFNSNTLIYELVIPEKTKGITVKPTAISPFATITVNSKPVKNGEASDKIVPIEVLSEIPIEVTAQDGRTKVRYVLKVRDENKIEKSSNADLTNIKVFEGAMAPRFKTGINNYEISLKSGVKSLDITPVPADEYAKIVVTQGTKILEKYDNTYSTAILEDETEFKITVTSPDATKTKEYALMAYRNNEEKAGVYKPITADMINFESEENPIYVDISEYTVVKAEVFNKLMQEYPDKSLVFEGNDYSLQINGKDMATLVPNTEEFDFGMTFGGPNNATVTDLIHALDSRNEGIAPVVIHFAQHGTLPAPMSLTVSLGGYYKNLRMYWNYYNEERGRIDYYGYMGTNAQGTFNVPITHMSDYAVTAAMVYGSENKVGMLGTKSENLGNANTGGKRNPQTGVH